MPNNPLLASAIFLFLLMVAGTSQALPLQTYNCPGSGASQNAPVTRDQHERLFEHAVLAELVYRDQNQVPLDLHAKCPTGIVQREEIATVTFYPVPRHIIDQAVSAIRRPEDQRRIEIYTDTNSGEDFIACTNAETFAQRIAVAFRYVRRNGRLSLFIKFLILGVTILTQKEELRILELQRDGRSSQNGDEIILGIQGTDFTSISQWNASIQNLINTSCVFDFAVEVATRFFGPTSVDQFGAYRHGIVGHSLGGAVAQHVAQHTDLHSVIAGYRNGATFQAYSFNSIGVKCSTPDVPHQSRIRSVRIAGEVLEQMEPQFRRRQIGHIYRYDVPSSQSSTNQHSLPERIRLHKIDAVQDAICRCLGNSRERFEYRFR